MRTLSLALVALTLLTAACASGAGSRGGSGSGPNILIAADLQGFTGLSAYEALERLRPGWLRGRSAAFTQADGRVFPAVFLDGRPWGDLESLHQIDIIQVGEMRFISASDATTRYGTGFPAGIIAVSTRRQGAVPPGGEATPGR